MTVYAVRFMLALALAFSAVLVTAGAQSEDPRLKRATSSPPGVAVYSPSATRLVGAGSAQHAALLSKAGWMEGSDTVVIAPSRRPLYAALAAPLAAVLDVPVLLADSTLPSPTTREIERLGASSAVLVGSSAIIGTRVTTALRARGLSVNRLTGADTHATAKAVATYIDRYRNVTSVVVGPASTVPALVAAAEAARLKRPLLFAGMRRIPPA